MANNPYVNKVVYGNQTLIDISDTTATASDVVAGKTIHTADGALRTGTATYAGSETAGGPANDSLLVNGHTVLSDVPANAVFTDTTYESKNAESGGTDVSLVTTGDKYTWNNKLDANLGSANSGKFLIVGSTGAIETVTMAEWQGGSY